MDVDGRLEGCAGGETTVVAADTFRGGVLGPVEEADSEGFKGEVVRDDTGGMETFEPEGVSGGRVEVGRDCHKLVTRRHLRAYRSYLKHLDLTRSNKHSMLRLAIKVLFSLDRSIIFPVWLESSLVSSGHDPHC